MKRTLTLALAAGLLVAGTGCTALSSAQSDQAKSGANDGYVKGDQSVQEFAADKRGEPIVVAGTDTAGKQLSSKDFRDQVVVLNLWYAACGPCRNEAPDLRKVADQTADTTQFIGINTRDDAATAKSFERTFAMPYPSIIDQQGDAVLALRGVAIPNAVPFTVVLDKKGRVASRISGIADPSILKTLIKTAAEETP